MTMKIGFRAVVPNPMLQHAPNGVRGGDGGAGDGSTPSESLHQKSGAPTSIVARGGKGRMARRKRNRILARTMSAALCSDTFIKKLHDFPQPIRETIIGYAIEYHIIFRSGEGFDEYIDAHENAVYADWDREYKTNSCYRNSQPLVESIAVHLGIDDLETMEAQRTVYEHYYERFTKRGFAFHGFNGMTQRAIEEQGLSPDMRFWDEAKVKRANAIFRKYDQPALFHRWENIVHYAGTPMLAYYYATHAPAAFGERFSETGNYANPFCMRNYMLARNMMAGHCRSVGLSSGENEFIMESFDELWEMFAGEDAQPKLALIDRNAVDIKDSFASHAFEKSDVDEDDDWDDEDSWNDFNAVPEKMNEAAIAISITNSGCVNGRYKKTISPQNILIVDLPSFNDVNP